MSSQTESHANPSLRGTLLVATPFIQAAPYRHAVVLVVNHGDRGAFGLVLDNQLQEGLKELAGYVHAKQTPGNRLAASQPDVRLVVGAIVWAPNQLEREIEQGIWLTSHAQLNSQISPDLWVSLLRQIGRSVLIDTLHIKGFPSNPILN